MAKLTLNETLFKETARDFIALGGVPFFIITVVRVLPISLYYPLEFIVAFLVFFCIKRFYSAEIHAGLGVILLCFTSLFYRHILFTIFALLLYVGIIFSLFYLGKDRKEIIKGVLLGSISTIISYLTIKLLLIR